jgi:RNA polymerase sigma-70 factor (ECF subfamily)
MNRRRRHSAADRRRAFAPTRQVSRKYARIRRMNAADRSLVDGGDASAGEVLVDRIRGGDGAAESELVSRYARGVRMIISRGTRDRSIVDDLCQETFRIAIEKIRRGDVRDAKRLSGFMCGLARNITVDHFRRSRRADSVSATNETDPAPNQLERLLADEGAGIARKVLSELDSHRDREVLFRFYVAEETKARICADLGLSSLHFNRVLFRARGRYRALYETIAAKDIKS